MAEPIRLCLAPYQFKTQNEDSFEHGLKSDSLFGGRHRFNTVAPSRFPRLNGAPIGALPRNRLADSATGGASALSSDKSREKWGRARFLAAAGKEGRSAERNPPWPDG